MKQSSKNNEFRTAALYCRLSRDDNLDTESNSISNQENICQGGFHPKDEIPRQTKKICVKFLSVTVDM